MTATDHVLFVPAKFSAPSFMLTVEFHNTLTPIDSGAWTRLFPNHPDPPELIELMDTCRMPSCSLGSILVRRDEKVILILPTFLAPYDLTTTLTGKMSVVGDLLKTFVPSLLHPKLLGVGFVEGEWGQVGIDPSLSLHELNAAWQLALRSLDILERKTRPDIVCFKDFTQHSGSTLPMHNLSNYIFVASLPYCQMTLSFKSLDEYLNSLNADMRRYLKRVWRRRGELDIVRTREPQPWIDSIYKLYEEQVEQSETSFGVHPKCFFSQVCQRVIGAEYFLYFAQNKLIGFELLVVNNDSLVQKYIGIDQTLGREYKLFFLSWLENLQYCLDRRITHTHVGATREALKVRLGAELIPSAVLFRHVNPIINKILTMVQSHLAYSSQVEMPLPNLGVVWQQPESAAGKLGSGAAKVPTLVITAK
jgi:hypothetical protein